MNIVQLLDHVGHKKLGFQWLHECLTNARSVGRGRTARTALTFQTQALVPGDLINPMAAEKVGLVIWMPLEDFERVQAMVRAEREAKTS